MSTETLPVNGTEIWTDELRELSAAGPSKLDDAGFAKLAEFAAAHQFPDCDLVVQYENDMFVMTNVYRRYSETWTHLDSEDGADQNYRYDWDRLPILMVRDKQEQFVALNTSQHTLADQAALDAAPHLTIATTLSKSGAVTPDVVQKFHGEWVDLNYGVNETWTTASLLSCGRVGIIWTPPADEEDEDFEDDA